MIILRAAEAAKDLSLLPQLLFLLLLYPTFRFASRGASNFHRYRDEENFQTIEQGVPPWPGRDDLHTFVETIELHVTRAKKVTLQLVTTKQHYSR